MLISIFIQHGDMGMPKPADWLFSVPKVANFLPNIANLTIIKSKEPFYTLQSCYYSDHDKIILHVPKENKE